MTSHSEIIETSDRAALPVDPVVSVYMAAYNHEPYIAQAIEGVLEQSVPFPIELLIAEDASTDGTRAIVLSYQRKYPSVIRVVTGPANVGARANFKRCAAMLSGKYVAFCEGDDYWNDTSKLSRQVSLFKNNPGISLVCHAVHLADESKRSAPRAVHRVAGRSRILSDAEIILGDGGLIPTCSIVVRSDILQARPAWWENAPIGDYPLVLRAAQLGHVCYIDRVMGAYRINVPGSWTASHKRTTAARGLHAAAMQSMLLGYLDHGKRRNRDYVRRVISKYFFDAVARTQGSAPEKQELLRHSLKEMNFCDRWIARASVVSGWNLGWIRTSAKIVSRFFRTRLNDAIQNACRLDEK